MEVFKFAVLSSEEARSHGAEILCRVDKRWNNIANATSDLWTKVTFAYPYCSRQFSVARERLKASEPKTIDVEIDLRNPNSDELEMEDWCPSVDFDLILEMVETLRGSEHRWRSISIKSDTSSLVHDFLREWAIPSLPALESISLDGFNRFSGVEGISIPEGFIGWPVLFGSNRSLMPKLREVSISAIYVDWATFVASPFRNLCKLEIKNQSDARGPTFGQFAELLAAAPRLETLDVSGYCPEFPTQTQTPLVHLPVLKRLVFGWNRVDLARNFLVMFQIPETLETLSLIDVDSGLGARQDGDTGNDIHNDDSSQIFKLLANLAPGVSENKDPSKPWISMLGLKSLSVSWVASKPCDVTALLHKAPKIEEIRLTDVNQGVLQGVKDFAAETQFMRSLKRVHIRWIWNGGCGPEDAHVHTNTLKGHGLQVSVKKFTEGDILFTPIALEAQLKREDAEPPSRSTVPLSRL